MIFFFFLLTSFILGTAIGSFLNVVIFRLKSGESFGFSHSKCPHCGRRLRRLDLVPILSFFFLKGKCRYCEAKIAIQYPLVELVTGLIFALIFSFLGGIDLILNFKLETVFGLIAYAVFSSFLIVIFVYDLKHYLILDKVLLPAFLFTLISILILEGENILYHLLASMIFGFFLFFIYYFSKGKWMGGGDVKLAFLLGLMVGFPEIFFTFFTTFVLGALVSIALMIFGKKRMKDRMPLGTFMTLAAFLSFFVARVVVEWYLKILGVA